MQLSLKLTETLRSTAFGLAILGLVIMASIYFAFFHHNTPPSIATDDKKSLAAVANTQKGASALVAYSSKPKRMIIPSLDMSLVIDDATIDIKTNAWPLSETNAQYANFTPALGSTKGTMLLYGHNSWPVMRKTNDLAIGDSMVIVDQNGHSWEFTLVKTENIVPENVRFIYEDVPFRVVIFTCNGWDDQYRRLMYFEPSNKPL